MLGKGKRVATELVRLAEVQPAVTGTDSEPNVEVQDSEAVQPTSSARANLVVENETNLSAAILPT